MNRNTSISFTGLLTIVLITLKLTGLTDISWWWVWAPIWVPVAIVVGFWVMAFLVVILGACYHWVTKEWPRQRSLKKENDKANSL